MDTRFLGTNLIALNETQREHRQLSRHGGEDAYYTRYTPADGRVRRIASAIVAGGFGFMAFVSWLQ
jgi:hypothetical protein